MKYVCAWCGKVLREQPGSDDVVSDGICDDCAGGLKEHAKAIAATWVKDVEANISHDPC